MNKQQYANQVIDALGGTSETALLCEISTASVSGWRKTAIPKARLMFFRVVRPDVFVGDLASPPVEQSAGKIA